MRRRNWARSFTQMTAEFSAGGIAWSDAGAAISLCARRQAGVEGRRQDVTFSRPADLRICRRARRTLCVRWQASRAAVIEKAYEAQPGAARSGDRRSATKATLHLWR